MNELVFIVEQESDGGYVAEAVGESIVTQGDDWNELRANVRDAVESYFFDSKTRVSIRLHMVRDEVLAPA
jgi:predicted RNase H-like HicB family nuclease